MDDHEEQQPKGSSTSERLDTSKIHLVPSPWIRGNVPNGICDEQQWNEYCQHMSESIDRLMAEHHKLLLESMEEKRIKTLRTLARKKEFSYSGSTRSGVRLQNKHRTQIDAQFFSLALKHFAGEKISSVGDFGEWIHSESARSNCRILTARQGSFIAAILCAEAGVKASMDGNALVLEFPS